jgi:alkyl hydroperoxide reductase subunit F
MQYDLIIIGGGPAGTAGAIYAARKRLHTLFLTDEFGGQSIVSDKIHNWIGTVEISGAKLAEDFRNHVLANASDKLEVKEGLRVSNVSKNDNIFKIKTELGEEYETKTILITTGSKRR